MKSKDILIAMGLVDESFIEKSLPKEKSKGKKFKTTALIAAVLVAVIVLGIFLNPQTKPPIIDNPSTHITPPATDNNPPANLTAVALKQAVYPAMAKYSEDFEEWNESRKSHRKHYDSYNKDLDGFFIKSVSEILSGRNAENRVYSPISLYMALGMLAELTEGNSRKQILDLLGYENMEVLRNQASAVWNSNYCDDGLSKSILGSSLWVDDDIDLYDETLSILKDIYYSSSFKGQMGSTELNNALRSWLNQQTGNFLTDYTSEVEFPPETLLSLITTVYYEASWNTVFSEEKTVTDVFHSATGDVECDFMKEQLQDYYYYGENFSAVNKYFQFGGRMFFMLPDEGVSVDELLQDSEALKFIVDCDEEDYKNKKYIKINLSVPKFDVSSKTSLEENIKKLGVTDVFDSNKAYFSSVSDNSDGIFLSRVEQSARVSIDEIGCVAAAYTELHLAGSAAPREEEIDFVLDRPFIFVITEYTGLPLFVGVVETP